MSARDFRKKQAHIPIAREGIPYILAAMFATFVTAVLGWAVVTLLLLAATLLIGHFFRDPERVSIAGDGDIVSPADGCVIGVSNVRSVRFIDKPATKISIFMSVLDVHVNRIPGSGTIEGIYYRKGRFMAANLVQASDENEQNWLWIKSDSGADIVITQVAGLIARRIVCWPEIGDRVVQAERFGMIRFGSRMDVYVPEDSEILVSQGKHVYAGETVLCKLNP
ncbi:Phosphatidylserine decarboxylase proenzyme [Syntrophobacter sp. SbD1]|nr:Phosphatidylserine decarboxylase proenzyme [Syntrophobacter sp. SbD1]